MNKIYTSLLTLTLLIGSKYVFAQEKIQLEKYDYVTGGGANLFNGKPSIGFPLVKLDIPSTSLSFAISLDYSTDMASAFKLVSDVGKGWNLTSVGSVVRNNTSRFNDFYGTANNSSKGDSDVYFYSCPSTSGQFYITKENGTGNFIAVSLNASNDKITFTLDPLKPNTISSFSITDNSGNRFLFDKININLFQGLSLDAVYTKSINSGFLLSKIYSPNNTEIANIEYETTTQLYNQTVGNLQLNKIKKINVVGKGSIEYVYKNLTSPIDLKITADKDRYTLDKLILKDTKGSIITQYQFNRSSPLEYLDGYEHLNKDNQITEKFLFDYNEKVSLTPSSNDIDGYGYATNSQVCNIDDGTLHFLHAVDPSSSSKGMLKGVTLPTGGRTEYEFEPNALPITQYSTTCTGNIFCKYFNKDLDKLITLQIDQNIGVNSVNYTIPNTYENLILLKFSYRLTWTPPYKPGEGIYANLYANNEEVSSYLDTTSIFDVPCDFYYATLDDNNHVNFTFNASRNAKVSIEVYGFKKTPRDTNEHGRGLRIKSIKNFDKDNTQPRSYIKYDYSLFSDSQTSSGEIVDNLPFYSTVSFDDWVKPDEAVGYTQIKTTNVIDGSYTKYYYHRRFDSLFPINSSLGGIDKDMKSYLQTSGLLQKKEDYSANNQLLAKTENTYTLKEIPLSGVFDDFNNPLKKVIISSQKSNSEQYINASKKMTSSSEVSFEDTYGNLVYSKETSPDGNIIEKDISYPLDKNLQKLIDANMVNTPLGTSVRRNGKVLTKSETKFDNPSHLYPTSVLGANSETLNLTTVSTLDIYDNKGNLVQATGKDGIPTTTIWGYYQTLPVVQIKGAAYNQIKDLQVIKDVITASNADADNPTTEANLITAIENLMKSPAMQNYIISASTYDPLVGVTNSISANGTRTITVYDNSNRVIKVTDAAGKTLKEYQYNYQH